MVNFYSMPGVFGEQRKFSMLFQVNGFYKDNHPNILRDFGIDELPAERRAVIGNEMTIMWNGPGMWLLESESRPSETTLDDLRVAFENTDVTVTDLSAARFSIRVIGGFARTLLKKGCPADIDSMTKNDVITSLIGHLGATIHCLGDQFHVYVLQSYGEDFWEWFQRNARQFNAYPI